MSAYNNGDYAATLIKFEPLAEQGDVHFKRKTAYMGAESGMKRGWPKALRKQVLILEGLNRKMGRRMAAQNKSIG